MPSVVNVVQRSPPKRHDGVSHVLVDGATMLMNNPSHGRQILVHELRQLSRIQALGDGRKAAHIGEKHRELATFTFERKCLWVLAHLVDELGRNILAEQSCQLSLATGLDKQCKCDVEQIHDKQQHNSGCEW